MSPVTASIHLLSTEVIALDTALSRLTEDEKSRAKRFHSRDEANYWISCRALLRGILGHAIHLPPQKVPFALTALGKPILPPPYDSLHFNLSHCNDLVMIAICHAGPVGIDLESRNRASELFGCEPTFCHPQEISALPIEKIARCSELLRVWTAKEALLKALGTGLSHPPDTVRINFQSPVSIAVSNAPLPGIGDQRLHELNHPRLACYQAFISVPTSVDNLKFI